MGLFSDLSGIVGDMKSLSQEINDIGKDVIGTGHDLKDEVVHNVNEIKQTVSDTATELKSTSGQIRETVKESIDIAPSSNNSPGSQDIDSQKE